MSDCAVGGCTRPHLARGWCGTHYRRWSRNGEPGEPELRPGGRDHKRPETHCAVTNCGRPRHRRDLCCTHYYRWRTTGDVQEHEPILAAGERARQRNQAGALPVGTVRPHGGYVLEKVAPDDPMCGMANQSAGKDWVLQHRLVLARSLGRPLTDRETVHHINGLRDDNRLDNLELWASRHPRGSRVADPHCPTCTCGAER